MYLSKLKRTLEEASTDGRISQTVW